MQSRRTGSKARIMSIALPTLLVSHTPPLLLLLLLPPSPAAHVSIAQISDLHLDRNYSPRGTCDNRCKEDPSRPDGDGLSPLGDYRCDPPEALVHSAIEYLGVANGDRDPDFIVWSGDSAPHYKDGGPDFDYIYDNMKRLGRYFANRYPEVSMIYL